MEFNKGKMQNAAVESRMLRSVPHLSDDVAVVIVLPVRLQISAKEAIGSEGVLAIAMASKSSPFG